MFDLGSNFDDHWRVRLAGAESDQLAVCLGSCLLRFDSQPVFGLKLAS
jgi:hypothetical protein